MEMTCNDAWPLVDAYLDGELSEARASLLRKHLLDCHACRNGTQGGRNLKRWFGAAREEDELFAASVAGAVPQGFAARVARRAFAGDLGQNTPSGTPLPRTSKDKAVLSFVLAATAIAAGLALLLALGARLNGRAVGSTMSADDRAPVPVKQVVEELERLNANSSAQRAAVTNTDRPSSNAAKSAGDPR
jgi:anti-sigma factor RsiW